MGFDESVYGFCKKVPRGRVTTYGEIARAMGKPGSARAVGQALKRNPYAPRVPCHRVVKSDGGIGGYEGAGAEGMEKKVGMLRREGIPFEKDRIRIRDCLYRF